MNLQGINSQAPCSSRMAFHQETCINVSGPSLPLVHRFFLGRSDRTSRSIRPLPHGDVTPAYSIHTDSCLCTYEGGFDIYIEQKD